MSTQTAKVAIVDDDPSVRKALLRLVRSAGFKAEGFASAEQFLDLQSHPNCLVLDVRLPGMSGIDLHRALIERGSRVPVVFISADGTRRSRETALSDGAVEFLHKPFDGGLLLDAIRRALGPLASPTGGTA